MTKQSIIPLILIGILFFGGNNLVYAQTDFKQVAREMLLELRNGETTLYENYASEELLKAVPSEQVAGIWNQLETQLGKASEELAEPIENKLGETVQIIQPISFGVMSLAFMAAFNEESVLTGIGFQPFQAKTASNDPEKKAAYDVPEAYNEEEVSFGSGTFTMHGILTKPTTNPTGIILIFISGSGPNDRHSTVGPNRPHQDMARGLAGLGIASLRFDKRTFASAQQIQDEGIEMTIDTEVVEDAVAAVEFARKSGEFDQIYLLGHSLGGMLAPRIATNTELSGIIIMAANSRPLEVLLVEQFEKLLDGNPAKETVLADLNEKISNLDKLEIDDNLSDEDLPLNQPPSYWKSLRAYNQVTTAQELHIPILILHAEADFQVTMDDFKGWKENLPESMSISYPGLDHLMRPSNGKIGKEAYADQDFVSEQVIQDIAGWILQIK